MRTLTESDVSVLLRTSVYRGDHSTDVTVVHDLQPGETVVSLVDRLIPHLTRVGAGGVRETDRDNWHDHVELRIKVNGGES